ncbi:MAG: efflux RND transporter periplasmic adaptor subunit [Fibrobacter sp.]|nr:efflux RND transporter periplasmic adaptor subunit [Fibrobacter sp.]
MKTKLTLFLAFSFICIGCQGEGTPRKDIRGPVKVSVKIATLSDISESKVYSGSLAENMATAVSFSTPGTVKTLNIAEGKKVSKGTLVATLDDTSAKSALEIATAMKNQAEDARSRMEKLYQNKSISEIQWMDVESKYKQALASEKLAKKALDDCKLYAPATGIVSGKNIEIGQNVLPGAPIFRILDISRIKVRAFIPEKEVGKVKVGDGVKIRIASLGDKVIKGKITNRSVSANALSRSYEIEAELANRNGELLPGMIAEMEISGKTRQEGVVLPATAIMLDEDNNNFVWKINGGKATRTDIDVTLNLGKNKGILVRGLQDGDSIIVAGANKVGEGEKVQAESKNAGR